MEVMVREMQFKDTRMSRNNFVEDIFSKFFLLTNSQSNIVRIVTGRIVIKLNPNIATRMSKSISH